METGGSLYNFGHFTLDLGRGAFLKGNEEIKLRPKVYDALKYLVQHPGRLIEKQELIQAVWPDSFVTDDSLVQCTVELRRALDDHDQQLLKTVPRRGYIFTAQVTQSATQLAPGPAASLGGESFPFGRNATSEVLRSPRRLVDLPNPRTSLVGREREVL